MADPARLPPDPAAAAPARGRWGILALLMLASAANQLHRISLPAVGDQVMAEHGFSEQSMGVLFSVFIWSYTAFMIAGGVLADRIGTWWTLTVVLLGSSLCGAITGTLGLVVASSAGLWWGIAAARSLMGVASAPIYPSTSRTVASWFSPRLRVLANSLVIGAALAGIAGAQQLMSWLSVRWGWRSAFLWIGCLTLAPAALWMALGGTAPGDRHGASQRGAADRSAAPGLQTTLRFLGDRSILPLTLSYATVGYFEYLFFYWSKHYFKGILGLSEAESADHAAIPNYFMMAGTPLGGLASLWAVRRWGFRVGLRAMAMSTMTLAAAFLVAGALVEALWPKVILLSLALGFIGASEGPFWTAAVHLGGRLGGASGGFVNTGGNLLGALAPIVTPWIAVTVNHASALPEGALVGWTTALIAGAAIALIGACFWPWIDVDRPFEG